MKFNCSVETAAERVEAIAGLFPILKEISDPDLMQKIANVYVRVLQDCKWDSVEDACFNPTFPQQKLVNHIRVTTYSAYATAKYMNEFQQLDMDLDTVLFLGLMHDVCKFLEFEPDNNGGARVSEIGENLQHGVIGAYYAHQEGFSLYWLQLIVSHTPQSNNRPCCKEGFMFGLVDLADADQVAYSIDPHYPLFYDKI